MDIYIIMNILHNMYTVYIQSRRRQLQAIQNILDFITTHYKVLIIKQEMM